MTRFRTAAVFALVLGAGFAAAGCGRYSLSALKAQKAYKEANDAYRGQDWRRAAEKYEYTVSQNPDLVQAYFFLANSYDNLYKPARVGEAENDGYMQKALTNYKIAAERDPSPQMKQLAMQYLVAAYGPEKLNDPAQAEPIVQQMIQMDPNDPNNYFALMQIYEQAGRYDDAEQILVKVRDAKPNDPLVHATIGAFYNRQGDFEKTMVALDKAAELEPNNPEGFHRVATYYEEKVRKDHRLATAQKLDYSTKGIAAEDKALQLNPKYAEAMVYKNILLRHRARVETDPAKQNQFIREADELRDKAMELNKKKAAGVS